MKILAFLHKSRLMVTSQVWRKTFETLHRKMNLFTPSWAFPNATCWMICHWILMYPQLFWEFATQSETAGSCWKLSKHKSNEQIKKKVEKSYIRRFKRSFLFIFSVSFKCLSKGIYSQTNVLPFSAGRRQAQWLPVLNPAVSNISKPLNFAISLKQKSLHGHEPWH